MTLMLIQIQRWLMQPEVWRFMGFASTVVGLLCYALSSSFNYLFGEWNLLKIFLYSVFSIIICLAILFPKVWQHSTSLRLKAHLAFLVLAITSVYSFFFDKAVNGKPDAYSLISCAAFAIMSLSLSRQTHCGFEVDLLSFFLGCLIIQLMKIKLWLAIVGGGFSYCLIILRSSLDAPPETGYVVEDQVFIQIDSQQTNTGSALQVDSQQANTESALLIVPQEASADSASIVTFDAPPNSGYLGLPHLEVGIKALQLNNSNLISMLSKHVENYLKANVDSEGKDQTLVAQLLTDHNLVIDSLPSEIINGLHEGVKLMVAAGWGEECCDMYGSCRREFLGECLSRLKLRIEDVDNGMVPEFRIRTWGKAFNVALRILFPNEKKLCDRVFFGFPSTADLSFRDVCKELTIHLLNFANTFAIGSLSPDHLRCILKVFETLRDLIPEFQSLFSDPYSESLKNEAITIWKRLGETIRFWRVFKELENLIRHDTAQAAVPGGFYPITHYVMNYLSGVFEARSILEQNFEEYPKVADRKGSLSFQMAWIMELLESHLEAKSKNYTNPALAYVSMMNNGMYIQQKAKHSKWGTILGDDWIRKHTTKVQQNQQNLEHYQISSWDKVLGLLKLDCNESAESMKEKLNLFNMLFKELCSVQSTWFVFSKQLREKIRISLGKILLPAYGQFIGRFQNVLGKHADEYIEYGMYDIGALLNDLFRGNN